MRMSRGLITLAVLAGCNRQVDLPTTTVDETPVDERLHDGDFPAPPAEGMTLWGPEEVVPGATDKMFCYYGTYHGADVGIHEYDVYQGPHGHHMVLFKTT